MEQQESKAQTASQELNSKIKIGQEKLREEKNKLLKLQKETETKSSVSKETKKGIEEQIEAINELEKMIIEFNKELNKNIY